MWRVLCGIGGVTGGVLGEAVLHGCRCGEYDVPQIVGCWVCLGCVLGLWRVGCACVWVSMWGAGCVVRAGAAAGAVRAPAPARAHVSFL
jgi:hypothetical protein